MPFDGTQGRGFASLDELLLDMVEFALEGGRKWTKGRLTRESKHCLLGAIYFVRRQTKFGTDDMVAYLGHAVRAKLPEGLIAASLSSKEAIMAFNDEPRRTFSEVLDVIQDARELTRTYSCPIEMELAGLQRGKHLRETAKELIPAS
jgi:hypothetical protein